MREILHNILLFLALTKPRGMLCPNGTVKPFLVSLVEPVAYLKSELEEIDLVDREEKSETGTESSSDEAKRLERRERLRRRAQLLVTGKQDDERDLPYLLDCLREAAGGKRCWGTEPTEPDASRLRGLSNAILLAKSKTQFSSAADDDRNFAVSLHDHA